ncbi:D-2-hydroxyacid dehydrogenase [Streptomyces sp. NPDC059740]|uniref:D-2-hydroxyacid dehydrogenase n=1 Tax=Streptomyces sp. NPDC059740 TaxID=3346926 RepID=UPI00364677C8
MTSCTVLVLGGADAAPPDLGRLAGRARVVHTDEKQLAEQLPTADVLLAWDFTSDAVRDAWPGDGPRPAWVHTASAGVDRLLCPALVADDTLVTNARGVFEQPIAEYVAGLVIAMAKDFHGTWELQRQRRWRHRETLRVAGSRALVVGSGPIGRAVGRTLKALGVAVDLVGRTARPQDPEFEQVRAAAELDRLLPSADWVVCAAPLTEENRGMFARRTFALMKETARFVNIGRGPLVVERDLVAALRERRIAAAALDVFEHEPLAPDDPLWDVPHLVVSPHMSGDTLGWRDALAEQFADNFDLWAAGRTPRNVVDKRRGYVPVD